MTVGRSGGGLPAGRRRQRPCIGGVSQSAFLEDARRDSGCSSEPPGKLLATEAIPPESAACPPNGAVRTAVGRRECPLHASFLATYAKRSEEHTSELQSLIRISYAVFCLNKTTTTK